jgi:hypothetical protein
MVMTVRVCVCVCVRFQTLPIRASHLFERETTRGLSRPAAANAATVAAATATAISAAATERLRLRIILDREVGSGCAARMVLDCEGREEGSGCSARKVLVV